MNYSVSMLTTKADCQALIDIASAEKESLQYRRTGLVRQRQSATASSAEIDAELVAVIAELDTLRPLIESLPEGNFKTETIRKYKKSEYKKFLLEQRKGNYGVLALLEKEYDIACVDDSISQTDAFVAALRSRMQDLP
jgi:hypothetical protein